MNLVEAIKKQRVSYIISSYRLQGTDSQLFDEYLEDLLGQYPTVLVELALVETLVDSWIKVPLLRGYGFLSQAHERLKGWQSSMLRQGMTSAVAIAHTVTPDQFHQITGLDPKPIFGDAILATNPQ
jgi:hypothetical protein